MHIYDISYGNRQLRTTVHPKSHVIIEVFEGGILVNIKKFSLNDVAEYDDLFMSRFGPIENITRKNIVIKMKCGKLVWLSPEKFTMHNFDFEASKAEASNAIMGVYL